MQDLLNQPLALPCGQVLKNRLAKAALTEGLSDGWNRATERHVRLYRLWSEGGAGLVLTGNVQIDRTHLERPGNVVIDGNGGLEELRAYARAGTVGGNHLWMQINHPGRQTPEHLQPEPLAPSAVELHVPGAKFGRPRAMSEAQILEMIRRWAFVSTVARDTGFTGVQIHAAHGYLLSEFLSSITNRRTDAWGGSLENRARMLLEVVRAVRRAVGADFPVSVKINSADFQKGGFSSEECASVVCWLGQESVDLVEISGGNYEQMQMLGSGDDAGADGRAVRESTRRREAYFLEFAEKMRPVCTVPLMITGGFRSRAGMITALEAGGLDVIGLGRPMCVDPAVPRKLLEGSVLQTTTYEKVLGLAPGILGADVDQATHDLVETFGALGWFCLQLINMGNGHSVNTAMSCLEAFHKYGENEAASAAALLGRDVAAAA
jgi:2,4-dienoyl-CoA reductase-like NADH-dependent reductase (Old Yellow Enzyme family)